MLKDEYARMRSRVEAILTRRVHTGLVVIEHNAAISDPLVAAGRINKFLGGGLDVAKMAAAVDPTLQRNQATILAVKVAPTNRLSNIVDIGLWNRRSTWAE